MRSPFDSSVVRTLIFACVGLYGIGRGVAALSIPEEPDTIRPEPTRDYVAEYEARMRPEAELSSVQLRFLESLSEQSAEDPTDHRDLAGDPDRITPLPKPADPATTPDLSTLTRDQWPDLLRMAEDQNRTTSRLERLLRSTTTPLD